MSVFPAWLNAMKTAGVMLSLLPHFCRTYFFPLGLGANKLGRVLCVGLVLPKDGSSPGGASPGRNMRDIDGNAEENP